MKVSFSKLANIDVTDEQLDTIQMAFGDGWADGSYNMCVSAVAIKEHIENYPGSDDKPDDLIKEIYESLKLDTTEEDGFDVVFHRVKG